MLVFLACLYITAISLLALIGCSGAMRLKEHTWSSEEAIQQVFISFFRALAFVVLWHSSTLSFKGPLLALMLANDAYMVCQSIAMIGKTRPVTKASVLLLASITVINLAACFLLVIF